VTLSQSDVIAIVAVLLAAVTFLVGENNKKRDGLERDARNTRDSEINRRLGTAEANFVEFMKKVHEDELETERVKGRVELQEQRHSKLEDELKEDIAEIKATMVTRDTIKPLIQRFDDLFKIMQGRPGEYRRSFSPSPEHSDPPPPRRGG
jgi:hypothetical protein